MGKLERTIERNYAEHYLQMYSFLHKLCQVSDAAEKLSKRD